LLTDEVLAAQRAVKTDAYQMSIGEIVNMYIDGELVINPSFQRLFRWEPHQKSKLIESLLLGIPLPPIFVFEAENGTWELIDGLQRISTVLEFMGYLKDSEGRLFAPSVLDATKYLPSLHNTVWESTERIADPPLDKQKELEREYRLAIRRARLGVEILKRPSDVKTKFDLFQRLNAGGTVANSQELRNCVMIMIDAVAFELIKAAAEDPNFIGICSVSEDQREKQRHMEMATRFLVMTFCFYDGKLDVDDYLNDGIAALLGNGNIAAQVQCMTQTFDLLHAAIGINALKRHLEERPVGKVNYAPFEGIAVGIGRNIDVIRRLPDPLAFLREKIASFWVDPVTIAVTGGVIKAQYRLQRMLPFGQQHFCP